jgi:hypothetical protein
MHQNHQTRNAKPLLKLLLGISIARPRALAAVALGMVASLTPAAVHAQEYPWCLSRDRLSLLLDTGSMPVDSIRHRRLRSESAVAVPNKPRDFVLGSR